MTTQFKCQYGRDHTLSWDDTKKYSNGRIALQGNEEGVPYLIASVNIPDIELEEDEMCIKDYSENKGILQHLIDNRIISNPVKYTYSGYVRIPIVKYLGLK